MSLPFQIEPLVGSKLTIDSDLRHGGGVLGGDPSRHRPLMIISLAIPPTLDALAHDALVLPPDQRVALAYRLLVGVDPGPEPGAEAAWDAEIAQRIARFDSGEAKSVPAAEVFDRLHQIAPEP